MNELMPWQLARPIQTILKIRAVSRPKQVLGAQLELFSEGDLTLLKGGRNSYEDHCGHFVGSRNRP